MAISRGKGVLNILLSGTVLESSFGYKCTVAARCLNAWTLFILILGSYSLVTSTERNEVVMF